MEERTVNPIENLIRIHQQVDSKEFDKIWKEGIFIFDSNVLLDLYRLPESASKDLLKVLKNKDFNARIWIGFQVLVEFLNNRHEAISDQKNKFGTVKKLLSDCSAQYFELFSTLGSELSKLKLKQRHSLIDPDKFITSENIESGIKFIGDFIGHLDLLEQKQSDVNDRDSLQGLVLEVFNGKIGEGFTKAELDELYRGGEERYKNSIPPGYKDKGKLGSYLIDDREFVRKFGDLILWQEIIRKAKVEGIKHVVLITGDVKEDWWYEKRGKKLGPRRELLNEIYYQAPKLESFHMYDTSNFLMRARDAFNIEVQESSIKEAKILIEESRNSRDDISAPPFSLQDLLYSVSTSLPDLQLVLSEACKRVPLICISEKSLRQSMSDIFSYMKYKYSASKITVGAAIGHGNVVLRIQCKAFDFDRDDALESHMPVLGDISDQHLSMLLNNIRLGLTLLEIKFTPLTENGDRIFMDLQISTDKFINPPSNLMAHSEN